jgi:hypothetical protein
MSCLFESLSAHLPVDARAIRRAICDYLESNRPILEGVDTHSLLEEEHADYVRWMRDHSTWGGAIEIKAACDIWDLVIRVHNERDATDRPIQFVPSSRRAVDECRAIDLHWNGGHYYA